MHWRRLALQRCAHAAPLQSPRPPASAGRHQAGSPHLECGRGICLAIWQDGPHRDPRFGLHLEPGTAAAAVARTAPRRRRAGGNLHIQTNRSFWKQLCCRCGATCQNITIRTAIPARRDLQTETTTCVGHSSAQLEHSDAASSCSEAGEPPSVGHVEPSSEAVS